MKRITFVLLVLMAMSLFSPFVYAQPPNLEGQITLPTIVNGASSVGSDGYGQHFVGVWNGQIKHYLVGNDGVELTAYRGTVSTSGTFPVLTVYAGKLRTTFNIGTQICVYQSTNGGIDWSQVSVFNSQAGSVNNIDAYTDFYGTHIVWQDRDDFTQYPEVYYVRWDDRIPNWADYKNVSDLPGTPGQWGAKPKVVTSANEAHVAYPHNGNSTMVSRDLNLTNSQWDNAYATPSSPYLGCTSLSTAVIGNTLYAVVHSPALAQQNPAYTYREIRFAYRDINSLTWQDGGFLTGSHLQTGFNYKNLVVAKDGSESKLCFINTCYQDPYFTCNTGESGVQLRTYVPGSGWSTEQLGSTAQNDNPMLSTNQTGVYAFWGDANSQPGTTKYMRRKPFTITKTIAERTLFTGNNWVSGQATNIESGFTVDALANSITNILDNSWLTVNGTLNANANSQFTFGENGQLNVYGSLNGQGTSSHHVTFSGSVGPNGINIWNGISILGTTSLNYCDISYANTGVSINTAKATLTNCHIYNCFAGMYCYGINHPKLNCTIEQSEISNNEGTAVFIESANNVTMRENVVNSNVYALYVVSCNPSFYSNGFRYNNYGVNIVFDHANPRFGGYALDDRGNNNIEQNIHHQIYAQTGDPFFGLATQDGVLGGYNCITYGQVGYLVFAKLNSSVTAEKCYWGSDPPDESKFLAISDAKIDYEAWLSSCERGNHSPQSPGDQTIEEQQLQRALLLRARHNYAAALGIYRSLIGDSPHKPEALTALAELRNTYYDLVSFSGDSTMRRTNRDFLEEQMTRHPNATLRMRARQLHAHESVVLEEYADAVTEYRDLLAAASTSDERLQYAFTLFTIHAEGLHDRSAAATYLAQLRREWPNDRNTRLAEVLFAGIVNAPPRQGVGKSAGESAGTLTPLGFSLSQNYPNPFNPTTIIQYSIPKDAHVSLVVYDVLGREVAVLESGVKSAGSYTINFDASRLASGVYMYRLQADEFNMTRKMLVVK